MYASETVEKDICMSELRKQRDSQTNVYTHRLHIYEYVYITECEKMNMYVRFVKKKRLINKCIRTQTTYL